MQKKSSENNTSGFAGFLDGYKAHNIAVSTSTVNFHFEEIKNAIEDICVSQHNKNAPDELIALLERLRILMNQPSDNIIPIAVSIGETIKTILFISKKTGDPSSLYSEERMKRLIYHYLELAELVEDKTVSDLAISIGELY